MTLILKSNAVSKNNLGKFGFTNGPTDFSLYLDFENEIYRQATESYFSRDINDVVIKRPQAKMEIRPITIDKHGNQSQVSSLSQVRTAKLKNGRFGLLSEPGVRNIFINPASPANQTISTGVVASGALVVTAEGTGSVTISGGVVAPIVVNAGEIKIVTLQSKTATNSINVAVSGALNHVQISALNAQPTSGSKIIAGTFTTVPTAIPADQLKIIDSILNDAVAIKDEITIVYQTNVYNIADNLQASGYAHAYAETIVLKSAGGAILFAGENIDNPALAKKHRLAFYPTSTQIGPVAGRILSTPIYFGNGAEQPSVAHTVALRISGNKVTESVNGIKSQEITLPTDFELSEIYLGTPLSSEIVYNPAFHTYNDGIYTKMAIFDRAVTDNELTKLSTSWL